MLLIARAVLRRRWVALVGLGLVAGLVGATVTSAAGIARRTGTAYDRLEAATAPGDVTMFVLAGEAFALALGVPLGIAAGRILWRVVASGASVEGDALIPVGWMFAMSAGVLAAGVLLAVLPARRAATMHPAELLRAE